MNDSYEFDFISAEDLAHDDAREEMEELASAHLAGDISDLIDEARSELIDAQSELGEAAERGADWEEIEPLEFIMDSAKERLDDLESSLESSICEGILRESFYF